MTARPQVLLTFNEGFFLAAPLTRLLHARGYVVHHLELSGHQPLNRTPAYQDYATRIFLDLLEELSISCVIPLFDEVYYLSRVREQISCRTLMAPSELYQELHDKRRAAMFCDRHELPHVPTLLLEPHTSAQEMEEFAQGSRLFLKHADSHGGYGTTSHAAVASLMNELDGECPQDYVVQPYQPGELWVLQGLYRQGELVDYEILTKVSMWNDEGGVRRMPFHRAVESEPCRELLERVGEVTNYDGMLEFECLGLEEDLKILEFNPRFSADFVHALYSGSSLAENTVRLYLGQPTIAHRSEPGKVSRNSWTLKSFLGRQIGISFRPLLDPRWLPRWWKLEWEASRTFRARPHQQETAAAQRLTRVLRPPEKGSRPQVLVTYNDDNPVASELTRVLHARGFGVHHLNLSGHQPILQDPGYQKRALAATARLIQRHSIEFLIPVFEEVFFLSGVGEKLGAASLMLTSAEYQTLHDKRESALFNRRHGLPSVPFLAPDLNTTDHEIENLGSAPYFVKERDSRGGHGTVVCKTLEKVRSALGDDPTRYVIQPLVDGDLWILQGVYRDGVILDYEILKKISFWDDRGSVRRLPYHGVEEPPQAVELLRRVGETTGYQGMLEFECLGEPENLRILEYNPRFSADFLHSVYTGAASAPTL